MEKSKGLRFKKFITPELGVLIFWLVALPTSVVAVIAFAHGQVAIGTGEVIFILFFRVLMETMAALFQIHDVLVEIRDQAEAKQDRPSALSEKLAQARLIGAAREASAPTAPGENKLHY